jgi:hypothetical protein
MMLSDDDLQAAEYRARQFSGAYTGTSGTLAADSLRQIQMIRQLQKERTMTLDAAHAACDAPADADYERQEIPADWILRGERELRTPAMPLGRGVIADGCGSETAAERLLLDALEAVRDRRGKYGPPQGHFSITVALVNAAFGTTFSERDWATIMVLDKIARSRGPADCRDNDVDLAGYAACRAECREHP